MHLYVHIPFCFAKCDYCDFFSVPCGASPISDSYISAVLNEVSYNARVFSVTRWDTIYIGGGTPSLLSAVQIRNLVSGILSCVADKSSDEVTMEMNPETLTEDKLIATQEAGVTRLSIGIQSLAQHTLSSVHRHCTPEKSLAALETVRRVWKGKLNTDVIAGLPSDESKDVGPGSSSERNFISTIERVLSYQPDHFSLYTLTLEEGTPLYTRNERSNECDGDEADRLWLLGKDMLEKNGLHHYEVSNFAKDGCESKHNFAYWRQEDYIGCGAGACGTIYGFNGKEGMRMTNTTDIQAYTNFWNEANDMRDDEVSTVVVEKKIQEVEQLSLKTEEFEFLMMGLRTREGVDGRIYKERFGTITPWNGDIEKRFESCGAVYKEFLGKKYIKVYKNRQNKKVFSLTEQGILFLNTLLCAFA